MCQGCAPPKLRRTYSTGLVVVQVLGKPPRPCAGAKNSSTAAAAGAAVTSCSASSHSQRSVERPVNENRIKEEKHDRANCTKGNPLRGPSWKLFAGGEQTRLADGEVGDTFFHRTHEQVRTQSTLFASTASKYRACWFERRF